MNVPPGRPPRRRPRPAHSHWDPPAQLHTQNHDATIDETSQYEQQRVEPAAPAQGGGGLPAGRGAAAGEAVRSVPTSATPSAASAAAPRAAHVD